MRFRRRQAVTNDSRLSCLLLFVLAMSAPATAQQACNWSTVSEPTRQVIQCGAALTVEREAGTEVTIVERGRSDLPQAIELKNGAIFIEVAPGSAPTQIRTPHAIAAVRGTTYVVDAGEEMTSVFVLEGRVTVSKANDASTVNLGAGEGVDVSAAAALSAKTWGDDRVSDLLARFGR